MDILSKDTRTLLTDNKVREAFDKLLEQRDSSTTTITVEPTADSPANERKVTKQVTVRRVA